MSRLGSEISRLRKEAGLTKKQLAKAIGVSESYLTEVEAGRKVINSSLAAKISKTLKKEINSLELVNEAEISKMPEPDEKVVKVIQKPVRDIWNDALSGVLKDVPIYNYALDRVSGKKQLPVIGNRIEGYSKDKVICLKIEDNEMAGFRIKKDDLALAYYTGDLENEGIYLIEHSGNRMVRQLKIIEGNKLLLVKNFGRLFTETADKSDVKIIARLFRLEIAL